VALSYRNSMHGRGARRLALEALEPRLALDASGDLPELAVQPSGQLSGKIVYTSGGHGWQWSDSLGRWATDRGEFPANTEIVEDFGNQDQMTFFADYVLRAGGTVVPMRPVGRQLNEVVLDNDSAGVTYTGSWSNSASAVHYDEDYGAVPDAVGYRFASTAASETAVATYAPNFPQTGFYPVYTWVLDSSNRTTQLYRITDSDGGVTEIRVDHRLVGKGWVYLGTYHFNAGAGGSVKISNQSPLAGSVIADAIRFGNGMGDLPSGSGGIGTGSISGYPREDENSLAWIWRAVGQGNSPAAVTGGGNVSAPSRMAEHMNAAPFGTSVYIGFHSNGTTGNTATATARGAVGLIDSDQGTPNQASLALYTGRQINQDMQALNGQFEHNWSTRTTHTLTSGFGEIDEGASAEMDMTIIEVGFHDQTQDAQLLRDPKVREQLGRSTYEATLEYFDNFGGLSTPVSQPSAPENARAVAAANGDVTVHWAAGPTGVKGGAATNFRVFLSHNGYGFYDHVDVAGGGSTSVVIPAAMIDAGATYFKVVALNSGGASPASNVTGVRKSADGEANRILVVDAFDRFERTQNVRYAYPFTSSGAAPHVNDQLVDRVRVRYNNTFDYVIQAGEAIEAYKRNLGFDSAPNDAVISGTINLANYDAVIWLSGEESTANDTFNAAEQTAITNFLNAGGKLFVSGAEIGWDLDAQGGGASFYNNQLKADYMSDDGNSYSVNGSVGGIFAGLSFAFDNGAQFYDVGTPDVLAPFGGATAALTYSTGGTAGIQYANAGTGARVVNWGLPFETITTAANRAAVMDRVLAFFGFLPPDGNFDGDDDVDGNDFLVWQRGLGTTTGATQATGDSNGDGDVDAGDLAVWTAHFGSTTMVAAAAVAESTPLAASAELGSLAQAQAEFTAIGGARVLTANVRHGAPLASDAIARAGATEQADVAASRDGVRPMRRRAADRASALREPAIDAAFFDLFDVPRGLL
jgi:hypothetical protein